MDILVLTSSGSSGEMPFHGVRSQVPESWVPVDDDDDDDDNNDDVNNNDNNDHGDDNNIEVIMIMNNK